MLASRGLRPDAGVSRASRLSRALGGAGTFTERNGEETDPGLACPVSFPQNHPSLKVFNLRLWNLPEMGLPLSRVTKYAILFHF